MNDALVRTFCDSRQRWLYVIAAASIVAVATVLPAADDYLGTRADRAELSDELDLARQTAKNLPEFEERVAGVVDRLKAIEVRAVDETSLPIYRSRLVEIVREAGCQIRRIDVGPPTVRPWKTGDAPLKSTEGPEPPGAPTPFALERRSAVLAVDGPMTAIYDLLERLEKERTIGHAHQLSLQPVPGQENEVTLELELWLFALTRNPS